MRLHKEEIGSPYYLENRLPDDHKSITQFVKACYRTIDLLKMGLSREMTKRIVVEEKIINAKTVEDVMAKCIKVIDAEYNINNKYVVGLHIARYDREITKLQNKLKQFDIIIAESEDPGKYIKEKIIVSFTLIDVLFAKEKLLQLHNANTIIIYNRVNNITQKGEEVRKFDIKRLSFDESIELLKLIEKTTLTEDEEYEALQQEEKKEVKIAQGEFVKFEEVKEENVTKIKLLDTKPTLPEKTYTALDDIKEKMRKQFEEIAKKTYKDAGSSNVE